MPFNSCQRNHSRRTDDGNCLHYTLYKYVLCTHISTYLIAFLSRGPQTNKCRSIAGHTCQLYLPDAVFGGKIDLFP